MNKSSQAFGLAMQFLTRLPVFWAVDYTPDAQAASARFYPAVGVIVGAICAAIYLGAAWVWPQPVAALLSIAGGIAITGGLHEDGLADVADGLGGSAARDRALEIMRDSSVGVFGVLALGLTLALMTTALGSLSVQTGALALVAGHGISRYACVHAIRFQSYARASGAKFATPEIDARGHRVAALWATGAAVLLVVFLGAAAIAGLVLATLMTALFMRRYLARLGGYTGDCLGASQQICLLGLFLGLAAWG